MSDIYEDIRIVVQRHREQAAAEEREKVVAYLRRTFGFDSDCADEIEAGYHIGNGAQK